MNTPQFSKFSQYQPKKRDTSRRSIPIGLGSLMGSALSRHGISNQVNAAMVVQKAEILLKTAIEPHIAPDIRVISYHKGILFIACRYAEAANAIKPFLPGLQDQLLQDFPTIKLYKIESQFRPHAWQERSY